MTPDLKEKYDHQVKELYAAIGKACVDFEHVCHALRTAILQMLQAHDLANQKVSQVMMAELTAQPLLSIYQALIAETLVLTEIEKRICDQLCNNANQRCAVAGGSAPTAPNADERWLADASPDCN